MPIICGTDLSAASTGERWTSGTPHNGAARDNRRMLMAIYPDDEEGVPLPVVAASPVLDHMKKHGMPLTRAAYLAFNYDEVPDPLPAEIEAEIPHELREVPDDDEAVH